MMAVVGETTETMGAARKGMTKWYASIDQVTDTSSGSRVRRLGTIATSSKAYTRRPRLARPISISILTHPSLLRSSAPTGCSAGACDPSLVPHRLIRFVDGTVGTEH